jgi:hypothetical protein
MQHLTWAVPSPAVNNEHAGCYWLRWLRSWTCDDERSDNQPIGETTTTGGSAATVTW